MQEILSPWEIGPSEQFIVKELKKKKIYDYLSKKKSKNNGDVKSEQHLLPKIDTLRNYNHQEWKSQRKIECSYAQSNKFDDLLIGGIENNASNKIIGVKSKSLRKQRSRQQLQFYLDPNNKYQTMQKQRVNGKALRCVGRTYRRQRLQRSQRCSVREVEKSPKVEFLHPSLLHLERKAVIKRILSQIFA